MPREERLEEYFRIVLNEPNDWLEEYMMNLMNYVCFSSIRHDSPDPIDEASSVFGRRQVGCRPRTQGLP